ncbi:MAG: CDP-alcohol phosphatidyltransferase family protein [Aggregatilineales bacterium]
MLDHVMRRFKEDLLQPVVWLAGDRIHPTAITLMGAGAGVAAGGAILSGNIPAALLLWGTNRVLDGLDGTIARLYDKQSDFGAYLDTLLDHLIYAWLPVTLVLTFPTWETMLALLFMLSTFYINGASWMYLSSLLEKRNLGAKRRHEMTSVTMPAGLVEGTETVIFYTLFIVCHMHLTILFTLFGMLTLYTVLQRLWWAVRFLD